MMPSLAVYKFGKMNSVLKNKRGCFSALYGDTPLVANKHVLFS